MGLFDIFRKKEFEEIERLKQELEHFRPIMDIEAEISNQRQQLDELISSKKQELKVLQENYDALNIEYQKALVIYTKLRNEVSLFESKLDLIEFGVYQPVYDFEKSDDYRIEQNKIIELQKKMIASDTAAVCDKNGPLKAVRSRVAP